MKLSDFQAILLVDVLRDTANIAGQWGGLTPDQRLKLLNEIIQQQSTEVIDLAKPEEKP